MARMNVYIPDSLAEALTQFRESMSVSAVLREALEREMAGKVELMEEPARTQLFGQLSESALSHITRSPRPTPAVHASAGVVSLTRADQAAAPPSAPTLRGPVAAQGTQQTAVEVQREPLKATAPRFGFGDFLPQPATAEEVDALRREVADLREAVAHISQKVEGADATSDGAVTKNDA